MNYSLISNLLSWPFMLLGILYGYASVGFQAGRLCAADMMKKDLKTTKSNGKENG